MTTMAIRGLQGGALAALVALGACHQKTLPTAPSDLMTGITIYPHANFEGQSAHLTGDVRNLSDFSGPCEHTTSTGITTEIKVYDWNDCVSSVKVALGWRATLHSDDDFRGHSLEITADVPNLEFVPGSCSRGGLNDCITSIRVRQQ